ncbi:MAG TPA: DUF4331 family protein [Ktedonobacterales bacterium]
MSSHRETPSRSGLLAFALLGGGQTPGHAALAAHDHPEGEEAEHPQENLDLTDFFVFQKPDDPQKTILIMNVNPMPPKLSDAFDSNASYEFLVDTNGDAVPDIAFRVFFSPATNGQQVATVVRASGAQASQNSEDGERVIQNAPVSFGRDTQVTSQGDYRFYAGLRSDPFFFDLMGFCNNLHFTGTDYFSDKDVFGMVLEVPNTALGASPKVGIWCRILASQGGALVQVARLAVPLLSILFTDAEAKPRFQQAEPAQDRAMFQSQFAGLLTQLGHPADQAQQLTQRFLPDILAYDYTQATGFFNGRTLSDDVADMLLALVTNGKTTSDQVGPHSDYLATFPYLGTPHGGAAE